MTQALFLDDAELAQLTGRKTKSKQIEWLRGEGIPYRKNATGHPVVTRTAIEGRPPAVNEPPERKPWVPRVLQGQT